MSAHPLADSAPSGEEFTAWLTASCHQQGVPLTIRDPGVVTQVATLLGAPAERRSRHTKPARTTTQMPTAAQLPNEPDLAERSRGDRDRRLDAHHNRTDSREIVPRAA